MPVDSGRLAKAWPGRRIESRILPCHALVLVERGRGVVRVHGGESAVESGTLLVLPAGTPHSYWARPRWTEAWITFTGPAALLPAGGAHGLGGRPELAGALLRAVDAVARLRQGATAGSAAARRLAAAALGYVLADLSAGTAGPVDDPLAVRAALIVADDPGRWTPGALAVALGIPYPTLRRRWRGRVGLSVQAWLIDRRLDRARGALLAGAAVGVAAEAAGFTDPGAFRRRFVARYGVAPRDYRGAGG